jgi:hypothetical protein
MSKTTLPNISKNRRYESHANLALSVLAANPTTTSSFIPKFNTVSIFFVVEEKDDDNKETSDDVTDKRKEKRHDIV